MNKKFSMQSDLKRVKGLGSAKSGTGHWIHQRLTAVFLVPLSLWFIANLLGFIYLGKEIKSDLLITDLLLGPVNLIAMLLFLNIALYHGILGMKVIIEDYVHCEKMKNTMLITLYAVTIVTMVAVTISIIGFYAKNIITIISI
jgi:succinate dehydrogenase / fumarate reductase membrane anchor subunit